MQIYKETFYSIIIIFKMRTCDFFSQCTISFFKIKEIKIHVIKQFLEELKLLDYEEI